jgi:exopolysaccharide biosynthesis polyprenyl glycosylphosphotransferase
MLGLADALAAALACASLSITGHEAGELGRAMLFLPAWIVVAKLCGLYDRDQRALRHLTIDEAPMLLVASTLATAGLAAFVAITSDFSLTLANCAHVALAATTLALLFRSLARYLWRRVTPPQRVALIGDEASVAAIQRKLDLFRDIHAEVVRESSHVSTAELEAGLDWIDEVDRVIIASSAVDADDLRRLVALARSRHVKVSVVPRVAGMYGTAVQLNRVADLPLVEYNTWDIPRSTLFLKRTLDVVLATGLLILLSPVMAAVAVLIRLTSRGPVFFVQLRAGQHGRPFQMLKFRTMVVDAEALLPRILDLDSLPEPMFKLERDPRTTRTGRWLRRWSLDELPQLVNILRGEMSVVGPRPEQLDLVFRYTDEQRDRLRVRPGLTGPMQIYGRGQLVFDERLAVEREYIENLTIGRDLRILILTLPVVIARRGAF